MNVRRWLGAMMFMMGCADTQFAATNPPPYPLQSHSLESVQILSADAASRPYVEVGLIVVTGAPIDDRPETVMRALRKKAAEVGCDAIIKLHNHDIQGSHVVSRGYEGTCIVYRKQASQS